MACHCPMSARGARCHSRARAVRLRCNIFAAVAGVFTPIKIRVELADARTGICRQARDRP